MVTLANPRFWHTEKKRAEASHRMGMHDEGGANVHLKNHVKFEATKHER